MLEYNLGILSLLLYNLLTAAKGVFLGSFLQIINPFIVLSLCFGLVTIVFTLINIIKGKSKETVQALPILKKHWPLVLGLNISAVLGWGGYFYALKLIEPAIVFSFTCGSGPVITAIYYLIIGKKKQTNALEWISHAIICVILGLLVSISLLGLSAMGDISPTTVLFGTIASLICGLANVANTILTKDLNNAGLKPRQVIPTRFFLLILIGAFFVPSSYWHTLGKNEIFLSIFFIALIGVALPLFLVQVGIQKTNPITVALALASLPIFTLACQFFDHRLNASIYSVVGAFAVAIIYMISLVVKSPPQITIRKPAYTEES